MRTPAPEELLEHAAFVRGLARALTGDEHEAEDVAQDALVAALEKPRPVRSLRGFLAGVTRNLARTRARAGGRRRRREAAVARPEAVAGAARDAARLETLRRVVAAVSELEEPFRATILARYFDGLLPAAIAKRDGLPVKTVKSRLSRGLARLRARLDDEHGGDRRVWVLLLLPRTRPPGQVSGPALLVPGAILVTARAKLTVLALVLLFGAGGVALLLDAGDRSGTAGPPTGPAPRARAPDAPDPLPTPAAVAAPAPIREEVAASGTVLSATTGRPVAGARIRVETPDGSRAATTDEEGAWRLALPTCRPLEYRTFGHAWRPHRLLVSADGYATASFDVVVRPGDAERRTAPVRLSPVAARLTGRVTTPDGEPVAGALVRLEVTGPGPDYGPRVSTLRADDEGRFGPVAIAAGPVSLRAWAPGWALGNWSARVVPSGPDPIEAVLVLPELVLASGVVVDDTGAPVAGARVSSWDWPDRFVRTDEEGRFVWAVPDPGPVKASKSPDLEGPGAMLHADRENRIVLVRGARLSGRILQSDGDPVPAGYDVWLVGRSGTKAWTETGKGGTFAFERMPPGPVRIHVLRTWLMVAYLDLDVDLAPGEARTGLDLRLEPETTIHGLVVDAATGQPIGGAEIRGAAVGLNRDGYRTDSAGRFAVPWSRSPYGSWLLVRADGYGPGGGPAARTEDGTSGNPWRIELPRARTVRVIVEGPGGERLPGAIARLGPNELEQVVATDADGLAEVEACGQSALRVWHPRYGSWRGQLVPDGDEQRVVLGEPGSFELHVVDENGRPIPGAWLDVDGTKGPFYAADESGTIRGPRFPDRTTGMLGAPGRETKWRGPSTGEETVVLRRVGVAEVRIVDSKGAPRAGYRYDDVFADSKGRLRIEGHAAGVWFPIRLPWRGAVSLAPVHWLRAGDEPETIVVPDPVEVRLGFPTPPQHIRWRAVPLATPPRADAQPFPLPVEKAEGRLLLPPEPVRLWVQADDGPWQAETIDGAPGETVEVRYRPSAVGRVTGRVLGPDGAPVSGAEIRDARIPGLRLGATDRDGAFRIERHTGTVSLLVDSGELAPKMLEAVDLESPRDLTIRLAPAARIAGRIVSDRPLRSPRIRFHLPGGGLTDWTREIGEDGTIHHVPCALPAGPLEVEIATADHPPVVKHVGLREGENELAIPWP